MGRFNLDIFDAVFLFYKNYLYTILEATGFIYYLQLTSTTCSFAFYKNLLLVTFFSYPIFFIKTTSVSAIIFGIKFVIFIAF